VHNPMKDTMYINLYSHTLSVYSRVSLFILFGGPVEEVIEQY
jgi:hypothetical protein